MKTKNIMRRILVVDDDARSIKLLATILAEEGYSVEGAGSGETALAMVHRLQPDLILLDVIMPGMSGLEVCRILKSSVQMQYIPVICITGQDDRKMKIDCLEAGANEFLTKPIDPLELTTRIRNILFLKHYQTVVDENRELSESKALIERAHDEWEDTFDSLDDIITIHDRDYNIIRANKKARELLNIPSVPEGPIKCFTYYHGTADPPTSCPAYECMERGVVTSVEIFEPYLNRYVDVRVIPRMDRNNEVTGYIHIVRDITDKKKTQLELEKAYSELKDAQSFLLQQEKMASIGQLAAGVAHEINNPTGFIMSNLGSLQKYTDKLSEFIRVQGEAVGEASAERQEEIKKQKKALKVDFILEDIKNLVTESLDGAERIKKIVQDLKSFSRVDEAELKMADINAGIESTINIVWNELKYKATVKKEYGEIPQTKCNPGQLNQVFMNMLVNAAHAIEKQGEIGIRTWEEEGSIKVSISDTGSGIPKEKLGRIFEPFYTTKEVGKGTGLGLSIAYDIVKKHNGKIEVESEPGRGTTFIVSIPVVEG